MNPLKWLVEHTVNKAFNWIAWNVSHYWQTQLLLQLVLWLLQTSIGFPPMYAIDRCTRVDVDELNRAVCDEVRSVHQVAIWMIVRGLLP